jgi:hypothetical protein
MRAYHEERRQDLGNPKSDVRNDGPKLAEATCRQQIDYSFLVVVVDQATVHDGFDDSGEGIEKDHVSSLDRNVRAATHSDTCPSRYLLVYVSHAVRTVKTCLCRQL